VYDARGVADGHVHVEHLFDERIADGAKLAATRKNASLRDGLDDALAVDPALLSVRRAGGGIDAQSGEQDDDLEKLNGSEPLFVVCGHEHNVRHG
jgi:hypothetical protein